MIVVHAPTEISGQMRALVSGLRQAGYKTNGYNWFQSYLNYSGHIVNTDAYELIKLIEPLMNYVDLFHFHNGDTFVTNHYDLPLIQDKGKKIVMHHWGNDIRTVKMTSSKNIYPLPPSYFSDESIHEHLLYFSKYIKHAIVQDHELYPYVTDYYENVHVLPLAYQYHNIPYAYPSPENQNPTIIHAPTNREFKGSVYIEKVIEELRLAHAFTYYAVENMSHQQAMQMYLNADIIVDQILCGTYGMLSVEAMAMGKVVVAYIREDVKEKFPPDLPIVIANPDTLRDVLRDLLLDPARRHQLGIASRAYVERYHAVEQVIPQLLDITPKSSKHRLEIVETIRSEK